VTFRIKTGTSCLQITKAFVAPIAVATYTSEATGISGVAVPIIKSISKDLTFLEINLVLLLWLNKTFLYPSLRILLSFPVQVIHSSFVSTIVSSTLFERTKSGT
jgi:hypothetical protein